MEGQWFIVDPTQLTEKDCVAKTALDYLLEKGWASINLSDWRCIIGSCPDNKEG